MIRFPIVGSVINEFADEKVAMEVEALAVVGQRTSVPVSKVTA